MSENELEHLQGLADDLSSAVTGPELEPLMKRTQWILEQVVQYHGIGIIDNKVLLHGVYP